MVSLPDENLKGIDTVSALAVAMEEGRFSPEHEAKAKSLVRAFSSDDGWTTQQAALANHLVRESKEHVPVKDGELPPPAPLYRDFDGDTSQQRQALRGIRSGVMRRYRTLERDKAIWQDKQDGLTNQEIARRHKLCIRQVQNIVRYMRDKWVDIRRRLIAPVTELLVSDPKAFLSKLSFLNGGETNHTDNAIKGLVNSCSSTKAEGENTAPQALSRTATAGLGTTKLKDSCSRAGGRPNSVSGPVKSRPHALKSDVPGRPCRIFKSLHSWLWLDCNEDIAFDLVMREAEYLNNLEAKPLKMNRLKKTAEAAYRRRHERR